MKVLKFGGTSLGTPERMRHVCELIQNEKRAIVVLSALARTTDTLVRISQLLRDGSKDAANKEIDALHTHYYQYVQSLYTTADGKVKGQQIVTYHFDSIRQLAQSSFGQRETDILLAQGELMSTRMCQQYLTEQHVTAIVVPALDFMKVDKHCEPDLDLIRSGVESVIDDNPDVPYYITQGYICRNSHNEITNLQRGGSDYTASLIGAAIRAMEIQIWTDIDGMHNNDPRFVPDTEPLRHLSFDEAAELAYFGAKILHPASIFPAQFHNIPVRLLNTLNPSASGTLITSSINHSHAGEIKAIAAKDGITAIKVKSSRMLLAHGFLRRIFEIFERYETPIDIVATSEVAVSLTIDDTECLNEIVKELEGLGAVEVDREQTIICVVGDFTAERSGVAFRVLQALKEIPLRMISYGGSRYNISILIPSKLKAEALVTLHNGLFN